MNPRNLGVLCCLVVPMGLGSIAGGDVDGLFPRRQALSDRGRNTTSGFRSAQ